MLILGDLKTRMRIEDVSLIFLDDMLREAQYSAFLL